MSFGLANGKWVKTDANGHLATSDENPVVVNSANKGYLYANNGTVAFKNEEYVDLTSNQTISGKKTFTTDVAIHNDGSLLVTDSNGGTSISNGGVTIKTTTPFIVFSTPGTAANDASLFLDSTMGNKIVFISPHGVVLHTLANQALLMNQPTDTLSTSLAIATCGYV